MISVVFYKHNGKYKEIKCEGHAEYVESGLDIVCASVSVLVISCFNSVETFCHNDFVKSYDDDGMAVLQLKDNISHDCELLIDSLQFSLEKIIEQYGKKYLKISVKEV